MAVVTSGNGIGVAANFLNLKSSGIEACNIVQLCDDFDGSFNYLISSEWFSACSYESLMCLKSIFSSKFESKFIVFVRNPCEHINSCYLQQLKAGVYCKNIEYYLDELIEWERSNLNLVISLGVEASIINYDLNKRKLGCVFDQIVFGKNISDISGLDVVNPSPSFHQSAILKVVNELGISDFGKAMLYIESSRDADRSASANFLTRGIQSIIYEKLDHEISLINELLPEGQKIEISYNENQNKEHAELLNGKDLMFLKDLIDCKILKNRAEDFNHILNIFMKYKNEEYPELPPGFDLMGCMLNNPDVVAARVNPALHYINFGRSEG